jgi:hypothetical protein
LCPKILETALLRGEIFLLEIGHIGCQKIENFMLIFKNLNTFVTKCSQKRAVEGAEGHSGDIGP